MDKPIILLNSSLGLIYYSSKIGDFGNKSRAKVFDINNEQLEEALKFIDNMLCRAVEKGRMEEKARQDAVSRIQLVVAISDLSDCEIVIEAATENLEIKKKIFITEITDDEKLLLPVV